jgi:hypothetical protein
MNAKRGLLMSVASFAIGLNLQTADAQAPAPAKHSEVSRDHLPIPHKRHSILLLRGTPTAARPA